jgi:hypothetical protein
VANGDRAQDLGACTNGDPVADRGVAFDPGERASPKGYAVIDHHVLADFRGLTDDHAHPVVDEKAAADGCTRVDLDTGHEPAQLREQPGRKTEAGILPQPVRQPVDPDGVQAGVCEKVLERTPGRRVVGPGGVEVFL